MEVLNVDGEVVLRSPSQSLHLFTNVEDSGRDPIKDLVQVADATKKSIDGSYMFCEHIREIPPLKEILACLLAREHTIVIDPGSDPIPDDQADDPGLISISFAIPWSNMILRKWPLPTNTISFHIPQTDPQAQTGFRLTVGGWKTGSVSPERAPVHALWQWIFKEYDKSIRICSGPRDPTSDGLFDSSVSLYHCGVLVERDTFQAPPERMFKSCHTYMHLHIDIRSRRLWPEWPRTLDFQGAANLVDAIFNKKNIEIFACSPIARRLVSCALPWKIAMSSRMSSTLEHCVQLITRLPDEYLRLMDGNCLTSAIVRDTRITSLATFIFRRMQPATLVCDETVDAATDVLQRFVISAFATLPVTMETFQRLYDIGMFENMEIESCRHGLIATSGGCERVAMFPYDSTPRDITVALAYLITHREESFEDIAEWCIRPGVEYRQIAKECQQNERFIPYILRMHPMDRSMSLIRDTELDLFNGMKSTSIDRIAISDISSDPTRTQRDVLRSLFPDMIQRIEARNRTPAADRVVHEDVASILFEARGRKTSHTWSWEDIDNGGNLSSLGMSIMLGALLSFWHGAKVRICISECHTALLAYWSVDRGGWMLVDPSDSTLNCLVEETAHLPPSRATIKKGSLIEVKSHIHWRLAIVDRLVDFHLPQSVSAQVTLLHNNSPRGISLNSHNWRCLVRDDNTDTERIIRKLLNREDPPQKKQKK